MADQQIPANWYPDAKGTIRWWDGTKWTDRVREPQVAETQVIKPAEPSDEPAPVSDGRRRMWLTSTFVGLLTFFLGMGLGSQSEQAAPTSSPTDFTSELGANVDPATRRTRELDARERALDERERTLNEREDASPTPSADPTTSPLPNGSPSKRSIDDGTVRVGTDIAAGDYTTDGALDELLTCEYTISNDPDSTDVVAEDSSYKSMSVTLKNGQYFTSDNCKTWQAD